MKFVTLLFLSISLDLIPRSVNAGRILVIIPSPYFSHQNFYLPVWKKLAERGHDVVLFTNLLIPGNIPNLQQRDVSSVIKSLPKSQFKYCTDYVSNLKDHLQFVRPIVEAQFAGAQLQELIHNRSERFDLVISELSTPEMFSFKKRFKAPLIIVSPMDLSSDWIESTGSPVHELLYSFFQPIRDSPGLFYRMRKFLSIIRHWWGVDWRYAEVDLVAKKYLGEDALTIEEIKKEVDLYLVNTNHVFHEVRPSAPSIVKLSGGMFLQTEQPNLPQDLKKFLDESTKGVIYFSLGTVIDMDSIPIESLKAIRETFALLPYNILLKTNQMSGNILAANESGKIFISNWLPQTEVLKHINVKLFISHGGLQSLEEAVILKKPTIVFPFFADQHANANRIELLGLGAHLVIDTITKAVFHETINRVLGNKKIQENLEKHSKLLQDQPMNPLDKAVWWIEYVLRNKGVQHLHAKSLPWWQATYADVILLYFLMVVVPVYIIFKRFAGQNQKVKQN